MTGSSCTSDFPSLSDITKTRGKQPVVAAPGQYVFPEIQFDCEIQYITKWIYKGALSTGNQTYPQLQLWTADAMIFADYALLPTQSSYTVELTESGDEISLTPDIPIPVQAGHMLGIFIPQNSAPLYFDEDDRNGELSLYSTATDPPIIITTLTSTQESRYIPEVTVEISKLAILAVVMNFLW